MAQTRVVRGRATSIRHEGLATIVRYHSTDMVSFNQETITLDSGGWRTATTRARINQAANQFNLPFGLYQKNGDWFVSLSDGRVLDFFDGITFPRRG